MAAVTIDASPAMDPGPRGPVPVRTTRPAAYRSPEGARPGRAIWSWPLLVLAAPAAAEVWSGWVGIAQKTGFGLISPLPGIWPSLHLDTAITLPVGVEAYAAYALRLAGPRPRGQREDPPVRQVVRDLLLRTRDGRAGRLSPAGPGRSGAGAVARHHGRVLPAGPGPGHGDRASPHAARRRRHRSRAAGQPNSRTGPGPGRTPGATGREQADGSGKPVSRRTLRSEGIRGSNQALNALAGMINAELAGAAVLPARPGNAVA
jgi:hypothetical protein